MTALILLSILIAWCSGALLMHALHNWQKGIDGWQHDIQFAIGGTLCAVLVAFYV